MQASGVKRLRFPTQHMSAQWTCTQSMSPTLGSWRWGTDAPQYVRFICALWWGLEPISIVPGPAGAQQQAAGGCEAV